MKWLKYLVGLSAIIIAGCAAYFSVTGLGVLFSGATVAVMVMASSLEFAKLVSATYLKQKWSEIRGFNKIYLTIAVGILMLITSAGIFGYLSNAFQQQNIKLQQVDREISLWKAKISQDSSQIQQLTKQISEYNQNQGRIINGTEINKGILRSVDKRDAQIAKLQDRLSDLQDSVVRYNEKINEIRTENIGIEREVGGFRFVAESFGLPLNSVVRFFIILIVCVFDPLAIALVIAFNGLISEKSKDVNSESDKTYEIYGEKTPLVENIFQKPDYSGKFSTKTEENPVIVENSQPKERIIESPNIEPEFVPNPDEAPKQGYWPPG
jgi:hypothetical protein